MNLFSPYVLGDIRLAKPDGDGAHDPVPRHQRQCPGPARSHVLCPAGNGGPHHYRRFSGEPAGGRVFPDARNLFRGTGSGWKQVTAAVHRVGGKIFLQPLARGPHVAPGFPLGGPPGRSLRLPGQRGDSHALWKEGDPGPSGTRAYGDRSDRAGFSGTGRPMQKRQGSMASRSTGRMATCWTSSCGTVRTGAPTVMGEALPTAPASPSKLPKPW